MGVDISLHIEIRRQNQWHLMVVSCPLWEQHEHEYKIFDTQKRPMRYASALCLFVLFVKFVFARKSVRSVRSV